MSDSDDVDDLRCRLERTSEALEIVWGVLDDVLDATGIAREEYEESLTRLHELANLVMP